MANLPALQARLDKITGDLEHWNQKLYFTVPKGVVKGQPLLNVQNRFGQPASIACSIPASCGTAACLAGDQALADGWIFVYRGLSIGGRGGVPRELLVDSVISPSVLNRAFDNVINDADIHPVFEVARVALGLDGTEADALFGADNSLLDLWTLAYCLTDGEIVLPSELPGDSPAQPKTVLDRVRARMDRLVGSEHTEPVSAVQVVYDYHDRASDNVVQSPH
jgi:hypothetical protein